MAFASIKNILAQAGVVTLSQFEEAQKALVDARKAFERAQEASSKKKELGEKVDNTPSTPPEPLIIYVQRKSELPEDIFLQRLAQALGWPFLDLPRLDVPKKVQRCISTKVAFQYTVLPTRFEKNRLQIVVSNPFDTAMLNAVQFEAQASIDKAQASADENQAPSDEAQASVDGPQASADENQAPADEARMPVEFALAPKAEIEKALKKYYGLGAETLDEMAEDEQIDLLEDKEITEGDQEASVIKFVNQIIWEAFKDRATDIHFEPAEDDLRIRNRVDGILHKTPMPPQLKRFQSALISRIKVMSGMNIAEKRLPQDGRINVRIKGEEIDIRVSTVPTVYGESVSLRLLTRGKIFLSLDKLGYAPVDEAAIREIIHKPHGIFLVTGPTGSGKSTSLYAFLSTINDVQKRIITIEEPVEYELNGINQIAVRPDIGLTFAVGLRHILRQDPNVIMVGEIRDLETAEIAIRAALTGHLVFSTLHTNDAPSAFTRLIDMGIEPFLVASSVEAIMAQRLVRTICKHCKVEQKVERDYLQKIGFPAGEIDTAKFWHGTGCEECRQLGYQGRMGLYELLLLTEAVRPLILSRAAASTIAQKAIEQGMRTLRVDGWRKVMAGTTTIEEVLRVTQTEEHLASLIEDQKA